MLSRGGAWRAGAETDPMRISLAGLALLAASGLAACSGTSGSTGVTGGRTASPTTTASQTIATSTVTATATAGPTSATGTTSTATTPAAGSTGSGGAGVGADACRTGGLALTFLGQQGAAGHGELGFALRNTSAAGCSTGGYPGVQFLDRAGGPLPTTPTHTTSDVFGHLALEALAVPPGHSVSFRLGASHGVGSDAGCTTAYGLQIIAPNDTATLRVQIPGGASECGTTTVSPVRPGDSAYP
jgi:hypothetical protein